MNFPPQDYAQTRLGKLPLEIRLRIYEFAALIEEDALQPDGRLIITLAKPSIAPLSEGQKNSDHPEPQSRSRLQLLCVCRQMHEEAFDTVCTQFYSRNILYLADAAALHGFLSTLSPPRLQHINALYLGRGLVNDVPSLYSIPFDEFLDFGNISGDPSEPFSRNMFPRTLSTAALFGEKAQKSRRLLAKCAGLRTIFFDVNVSDIISFIQWLSALIPERLPDCIEFRSELDWTLYSPGKMKQAAESHAVCVQIIERKEEFERNFGRTPRCEQTDVVQVSLEAAPAEIFGESDIPRETEGGTNV